MNLPNKLTILRMIMIPFFVFFILAGFVPYNNYIALAIFALASFTDMLDGKIARKRNLVTNFGKFMDPLADKLLVVTALLCLLIVDGGTRMCSNQVVALIAVVIVVAREFVISGFRLVASDNGVVIAASMWGKFKTATTMVAIC
ncbi:MAG: CDP-diacylglycerol--glycerol-3-phosphate 3-phosphatidyltransferase, partial [Lachnospiraceae bacterium]|nr:CDP-diacylglycerol--glycerol-3-phosphate 3-phosphatidyltransferase [Lachnospiraceae bacterium]